MFQPLAVRACNEHNGLDEPALFNDNKYNSVDELSLIPMSQDLGLEHLITGATMAPIIAPTAAITEPIMVQALDATAAPAPHHNGDSNTPAPTVTVESPVVNEDHKMVDQSTVGSQHKGIQSTPH
ncbi:hypothetical protein ONZ51_g9899 [Trametes cubensis]|uniref:Uncharacterized protein n=1 Tax=Trametes cubensis TaxID=1111947 RepID=A0AAD7X6X6_9APHY|nr:hypothetical protein ONZ51_g9899 [Trametes cubensis]